MRKLLLFLALLPLFASAQIPAANDTTLIVPNNPFTPQFRFSNVTLSGVNYRIPQVYNSLLGKYDTYVTTKYLRAFYAPLVGGGYAPTSRTLTINGVTQDLSANRTWTINTTPTQASLTGNNRIALWNSNDSLTVLPQSYFNYNLSGNYFQSFAEWNLLGTTNMGNTHFLLAPSSGDNPIRKQDTTLYINPTHFNTIIPTATATALAAKVPNTRLVSTGNGILGGGNLGSNLTLTLDTSIAVTKTYANRYYKSGDSPTFDIITGNYYIGDAGGLNGTASALSIGGNAATSTLSSNSNALNGFLYQNTTPVLAGNILGPLVYDSSVNGFGKTTKTIFNSWLGINNGSTLTNSITGNSVTVTNGVYTTTFNGLGDARYVLKSGDTMTGDLNLGSNKLYAGYGQFGGTNLSYRLYVAGFSLFDNNIAVNGSATIGGSAFTGRSISSTANNADYGFTLKQDNSGGSGLQIVTGNSAFGGDIINASDGTGSKFRVTNAGIVTGVSFTGAGTGLTGTASGLNIGGNAATATKWGGFTANFAGLGTAPDYILGSEGAGAARAYDASQLKTYLGLGSNAYTSTAYLPLTGGTLTGTLNSRNILPTSDIAYSLGSPSFRFANTYTSSLNVYGASTLSTVTTSVGGYDILTRNSTTGVVEKIASTSVMTNPMTTLGDLPYGGASGVPTRLAGTTDNNRYFLQSKSVGGVATAPSYYDPFSNSNLWGGFQNFIGGIASNTHRFDDYGSGNFGTLSVGTLPSITINWLLPTHGGTLATTSDIPTYGQTTLTAGVSTITIPGLTTSSIATTGFVSIGGTVSTTWQYKAVCTTNTLTITAITNANTTNTTDTSILNYSVKL